MLASLVALVSLSPATLELQPTDDMWVYPHASDPGRDPFLRAWGSSGRAVAASADELSEYSYSYLKFDFSKLPAGAKLEAVTLVLTHVADPAFSLEAVKQNPLEVRGLKPDFEERTWEYGRAASLAPGNVFGKSAFTEIPSGKEFAISIDLLKGPGDFRAYVTEQQKANSRVGLALTSAMDASTSGMKGIYKVFSKDAERKEVRPTLKLTYTIP